MPSGPTSHSIEVRTAKKDDLDALVELNRPVQNLHARLYPNDFRADTDDAEVRQFFEARLAASGSTVIIAEISGKPVGYIWFDVRPRPENAFKLARPCIYIHQISVGPDARRQGVGTVLMRYVERQAMSQGIPEIDLDTWAANHEAHAFFEAHGFAKFNMVLRRPVNGA